MNSSNKLLEWNVFNQQQNKIFFNPLNFEKLIILEFFDGIENALALYSDGSAIHIKALCESRSRRFKAFKLKPFFTDLSQIVINLEKNEKNTLKNNVIFLNYGCLELDNILNIVNSIKFDEIYLAVGRLDCSLLRIKKIDFKIFEELAIITAIFQGVHSYIKEQ